MLSIAKKTIKSLCLKYPLYNDYFLISKLKATNFEYISFDIFDTLVKRNVSIPADIYKIVSENFFSNEKDQFEYVNARIHAEQSSRKAHKNREEISIYDIFDFMPPKYEHIKEDLIKCEIQCELNLTYANPIIKTVYDWCLSNNKKIIIVSDMYLSKDIIEKILTKCGYISYSKLYVSSDVGLQKATGNLFKFVLNDLCISPKKIVHIGDSLKGDFLKARSNHISSIRIATCPIRTKFINKLKDKYSFWSSYKTVVSGHIKNVDSDFYKYGIEALAPLLYGFSLWLNEYVQKNQISKLYFLARDGFLLEKVFSEVFDCASLSCRYLYVSRRALRLPILYLTDTYKDFVSIIPKNKILTKDEFFDLFNLQVSDKSYWKIAGFSKDEKIFTSNLLENSKLRILFNMLKQSQEGKSSYDSFAEYLKINDFAGKVAIVDIGWAGTIQKCLEKICSKNAKIFGLYLGLTSDAEKTLNGAGFIPSNFKPQIATSGLFEYPFLAKEGSLKNITVEKGAIKINLCDYEYDKDPQNLSYVCDMQNGVLDGIKILKNLSESKVLIDPYVSYKAVFRLTKKPSLYEGKVFGNLNFYDGSVQPLASPKRLFFYCLRPKIFLKDFSDSGWKVGFLKRLLKIPLPFSTILEYLHDKR